MTLFKLPTVFILFILFILPLTIATVTPRLLSLPEVPDLPTANYTALFQEFSPVSSSTCGYARATQVGISVNQGAHAFLRYKLRVKAIAAHELASADTLFLRALSEHHRRHYLSHRNAYRGGLSIPFLDFLGIDLDQPHGLANRTADFDDQTYKKLARAAHKIMRNASKQVIIAEGTLRATGISCMITSAYAFIKIAKVRLRCGKQLTVLTTRDDEVIAATKHGDTLLPSEGQLTVFDI